MDESRRFFLRSSGLALVGFGFCPGFLRRALAETASSRKKVLVTIFQRGAVDGLSMVPPYGEPLYYGLRPSIAIPPTGEDSVIRLDDTFGLHPALAGLKGPWDAGSLAIVHSAGSPDPTRSHFDAQDYLDSGTPGRKATDDGWLNRTLMAETRPNATPFRAVGFQPNLPRSLAGKAPAIAMSSISEFDVRAGKDSPAATASFASMYAGAVDRALRSTGTETFDSLTTLKNANPARFAPENGAVYPGSPFGRRMREIAQLIRANVGLEVAATDCGGWDTHAGQGAAKGQLANRLQDFGDSLGAFSKDLGGKMADVCVVTMTEFGRTARENGSRGTDHGHGSVMTVMGGSVKGRRVLARWKGLGDAQLHEGRDLAVTTDHREVLSEVLAGHMGIGNLTRVFPGFASSDSQKVGLF